MKAKVCSGIRSGQEYGLRMDSSIRIHKSRLDESEMADCFLKLKELVPTVATDKKLSKVQLLQHVIDYIMDLELTLEHQHPPAPTVPNTCGFERKPLTENNYFNTMASHMESIQLSDCDSRPVS